MALPDSIMLLVKCMTYNQKAFIEDAMNGFCMQKTSFPFICIIMDDCSTDGEQDTIKNYFQEHFTQLNEKETDNYIFHLGKHKTNEKCYFAVFFLKYNHYSIKKSKDSYYTEWLDKCKYIAMCEGDDYWTDENKLQIQVDFLEKHLDFSLCSHRYKKYYQNENRWEDDDYDSMFSKEGEGFTITTEINYLKCWCTKTMTLMYRKNCIDINTLQKYKHTRDVHLNYHLLSQGNGYCLPFTGAVYRINDGGIWGNLSQLQKSITNFWVYEELYYHNQNDKTIKKVFQNYINKLVFDKIASHDLNNSTRSILKKIIHTLLIRKEFKKIISFIKICLKIYSKKENFYRFC